MLCMVCHLLYSSERGCSCGTEQRDHSRGEARHEARPNPPQWQQRRARALATHTRTTRRTLVASPVVNHSPLLCASALLRGAADMPLCRMRAVSTRRHWSRRCIRWPCAVTHARHSARVIWSRVRYSERTAVGHAGAVRGPPCT